MTWSPDVCAWYWSGYRRSPIMPPWNKWCRCSLSSLSITRLSLLQPSSLFWWSKQTLCLWVLGNLLLWDVGVRTKSYFLPENCCCTAIMLKWLQLSLTLTFLVQLKKSGKEPKAGAELVCGNTTYKTKVWYNSTGNFCKIAKSVNHFYYMNLYWGLFEKFSWPCLNIFIQTNGLWLHLLVLCKITNLNY